MVGFTRKLGKWSASAVWNRTSRSAAISDRGGDHHDADRALQRRAAARRADALDGPAAAERERQQDRRRARAEGKRDREDLERSCPAMALTDTTAARIGPAHGAYRKPSAPPTTIPDQKPSPP